MLCCSTVQTGGCTGCERPCVVALERHYVYPLYVEHCTPGFERGEELHARGFPTMLRNNRYLRGRVLQQSKSRDAHSCVACSHTELASLRITVERVKLIKGKMYLSHPGAIALFAVWSVPEYDGELTCMLLTTSFSPPPVIVENAGK